MKKVPAHSRAEIVRRKKREKISGISANRNTGRQLLCRALLRSPWASIEQAVVSHDGSRIATVLTGNHGLLWDGKSGQALAVLGSQYGEVTSLQFSPDGERVATGSKKGEVSLWGAQSGTQETELSGLSGEVKALQYSEDGRFIVAATEEACLLWDVQSGKVIGKVSFSTVSRLTVISPNGWMVGTVGEEDEFNSNAGRKALVWDLRTGRLLHTLSAHHEKITCLGFSPEGTRFATGSADQSAVVWDLATGNAIVKFLGHGDPDVYRRLAIATNRGFGDTSLLSLAAHGSRITDISFCPKGERVVTASADGTACVWDASSGNLLVRNHSHTCALSSARFSPDGLRIVTTAGDPFQIQNSDRIAHVWDSRTGAGLVRLVGHELSVVSAVFSGNGERILTSAYDGVARLWEIASPAELVRLVRHQSAVIAADFTHDGQGVFSRSLDGEAHLWDSRTGHLIFGTDRPADPVTAAARNVVRPLLAIGTKSGMVQIRDLQTGKECFNIQAAPNEIREVAFSPDGYLLAIADLSGGLRIVNLDTQSIHSELIRPHHLAENLAFSPNGNHLICSDSENVLIWSLESGECVERRMNRSGNIQVLTISADGSRLGIGIGGSTALLLDLKTGEELCELSGYRGATRSMAFSPDSTLVATASEDGNAIVWSARTGEPVARLSHQGQVVSIAFDPTSTRLITASKDNTARVWDAHNGRQLARLTGHGSSPANSGNLPLASDPAFHAATRSLLTMIGAGGGNAITDARFSPDGRRALSASMNGTVQIWDVTDTTFRGVNLSAWVCRRMGCGLGLIGTEDSRDILLQDVLSQDHKGDLVKAVLANWPHLVDIDIPSALEPAWDSLLDPSDRGKRTSQLFSSYGAATNPVWP